MKIAKTAQPQLNDFKAFEIKKDAQKNLKGGKGDSIIIDDFTF